MTRQAQIEQEIRAPDGSVSVGYATFRRHDLAALLDAILDFVAPDEHSTVSLTIVIGPAHVEARIPSPAPAV